VFATGIELESKLPIPRQARDRHGGEEKENLGIGIEREGTSQQRGIGSADSAGSRGIGIERVKEHIWVTWGGVWLHPAYGRKWKRDMGDLISLRPVTLPV